MNAAAPPADRAERLRAAVAAHAAALHRASELAPSAAGVAASRTRAPAELPPIERILDGEWIQTPHGAAFVRDAWFAVDHHHGALPLGAALDVPAEALGWLLDRPLPGGEGGWRARFGFFDIETTGLSGGTGTYVFLAGLGTFEAEGFRLRQYFLPSVDGERAMLALLAGDLARCEALVTYNGRAFDVPVVDTRMTLARLRAPWGSMVHADLLHAVRRLYRHRMPSCRLADAERRLLGIERSDDIPGALVPRLYFDYVRAGRAAPLRAVFRHNADDVLSLAGVLARLARVLADQRPAPDDAAAAARWWERTGDHDRARKLYREALPWLEGGDDWAWAAHRHARLSRRAGEHDEAAALWRALWERGDADAGLALAKHLEHRARDYAGAAAVTLALRDRARGDERDALEARLARVRRKAGGRRG